MPPMPQEESQPSDEDSNAGSAEERESATAKLGAAGQASPRVSFHEDDVLDDDDDIEDSDEDEAPAVGRGSKSLQVFRRAPARNRAVANTVCICIFCHVKSEDC